MMNDLRTQYMACAELGILSSLPYACPNVAQCPPAPLLMVVSLRLFAHGARNFAKSELHAYMDQVLEAVRRDSHNRHVDETHLRKSRLSVLAVKGLSRARWTGNSWSRNCMAGRPLTYPRRQATDPGTSW
ncbi:hypothetical protein M405DRAFT_640712 [Rhizopogon salebrosus TDB-379]|nr:hypothetical protein M405DRAFT_640712 [Rhizopogon salebrosus TDB-379]